MEVNTYTIRVGDKYTQYNPPFIAASTLSHFSFIDLLFLFGDMYKVVSVSYFDIIFEVFTVSTSLVINT